MLLCWTSGTVLARPLRESRSPPAGSQPAKISYMSEAPTPSAALEPIRQKVIDQLCERFAEDVLLVSEFERRVDLAHKATTPSDLAALLSDLPQPANLPARTTDHPVAARPDTQPPGKVKERDFMVGIFGGGSRRGRWSPAKKINSISILGGVELDFREGILPPDGVEITVVAVMGGAEIIVPPGVHVDMGGVAIMGGWDHSADDSVIPDPNAPTIRINGFALMGGVNVTTRYPGETNREAKRRRRVFQKSRRKRLSDGDRS